MRCSVGGLLLLAALATLGGCTARETAIPAKDTELAQRIERLVETFLTSDDAKDASVLSDARGIFEREGIPTVAKVGDAAAYGFVLVNMLGQPPEFQGKFLEGVRDAATRKDLPEDALAFAEARFRQTKVEERYKPISLPILSCEIRSHASTRMTRPSASERDSTPGRCWTRIGERRIR